MFFITKIFITHQPNKDAKELNNIRVSDTVEPTEQSVKDSNTS